MSFIEMGFLSPESHVWINNARLKHSDLFRISDESLRMCQRRLYELELSNDLRSFLVAALYARCLSNYQGVILCMERGMAAEGAILARALLEATFVIQAIHLNPELAKTYLDEDILIRQKFASGYKQSNPEYCSDASVAEKVHELERTLANEKLEAGISSRLTTKNWAERAGMLDAYQTIYALLCADCHVYARKLSDQHLLLNAEGVVECMTFEPSDQELPRIMLGATSWLLIAYQAASHTLNVAIAEEHRVLSDEIAKCFFVLGSEPS